MKKSLTEEVYDRFKEDIVEQRIGSSQLISEQMIADRYSVSKTPAREALRRLCLEGYLISFPRKGYFLKEATKKEQQDMYELRFYIERGSLEKAIEVATDEEIRSLEPIAEQMKPTGNDLNRVNEEFHMTLVRLSHNERLCWEVEKLIHSARRNEEFMYRYIAAEAAKTERRIIDALLARDLAAAEAALRDDILIDPERWSR